MHQPVTHWTHHRRHGLVAIFGIATLLAWSVFLWLGRVGPPAYQTAHAQTNGYALQLHGNGIAAPGQDRVNIPIDAPARPADLGATDFTIEFWLKATPGENNGAATCGANDGWITANTLIDRDIFGGGDYGDFGIAVSQGAIAFGVSIGAEGTTLCSTQIVVDGQWHHVAAVRRLSGSMQLFVDGQPAGSAQGAAGDASYRDGRSSNYPFDPYLVFGAEKHDAGAAYPSFSGWLDEVRLSTIARYTATFTPPTAAFIIDSFTAGLYHFDEGPAGACTGTVLDAAGASGGPSNGACAYGGAPAGPVYVTDTPFVAASPTTTPSATATNTPAPATATNTPSATATNTSAAPTATNTLAPATATNTPSATATNTPAAPTATNTTLPTATRTPAPGTATATPGVVPGSPTATNTTLPTATRTPAPGTATATPGVVPGSPTPSSSPTATTTPGGTIPPIGTSTPEGQGTPTLLPPTATPTLPPCLATPAPIPTSVAALPVSGDLRLYLPLIQQEPPCASTTP